MDHNAWQNQLAQSGAVFADEEFADETSADYGSPELITEESSPEAPTALHFGDAQREYDAGKQDTALFDLNDRTQVELTGSDRFEFLNNFCTNDVKRLAPGEGCEAFLTNVKGRVLAHVFVFAEDESLWLESVANSDETIVNHLDRYLIAENVELTSRSAECAELFLTGPESPAALSSAGLSVHLPHTGAHTLLSNGSGLEGVRVRRVDWFSQPGFLLSVSRAQLGTLWQRLADDVGVTPAGAVAFHTLRIEAGFPLYGRDISEDNLAQEVARNEQAISFTKGCYLGQEPIARIDAMGHVNRELRGLRLQHGRRPSPGASVFPPENDNEPEKEIGKITSAVQLSRRRPPVALGYIRSQYVESGTTVRVQGGEQRVPATVFYD